MIAETRKEAYSNGVKNEQVEQIGLLLQALKTTFSILVKTLLFKLFMQRRNYQSMKGKCQQSKFRNLICKIPRVLKDGVEETPLRHLLTLLLKC